MRRLCAKWVPYFLNADQKQINTNDKHWLIICGEFSPLMETWVHYFMPETAVKAVDQCFLTGGAHTTGNGKNHFWASVKFTTCGGERLDSPFDRGAGHEIG